ncbi:hypothetical protein [Nocardioides campestrisoli]|uniref:hypothetical protein n=1 Tax=Nocardioides campestrisoli TaxID=2736757 RepID=UPI0015E757DF|nr:hypothetical protein [Nocardioides campestrisoli]
MRKARPSASSPGACPRQGLRDPVGDRSRRGARRAGLAAITLLATVATYLAVLATSVVLGDRAWRQGDHAAAERWFGVADRIDVVERWKAPYDLGVAVFSQRRWLESAELFARARAHVPEHSLCRVVLNEALALEVLGDELDEATDAVGAKARWAQAQQLLAEARGCSADGEEDPGEAHAEDETDDSSSSSQPQDGSDQDDSNQDGSESEDPEDAEGSSEAGEPDADEGDTEGEQGEQDGEPTEEGGASEAEQLQEATERLQEKLSDAPRPAPPGEEPSPESKADELEERTAGAARRRASEQDRSAPGQGLPPDQPTW